MAVEYKCCETDFFVNIVIIVLLVLFAGLMSGLTLGLMSMSIVDLEVLAKSGTPKNRKYAGTTFMLLSLQKKTYLDRLSSVWIVRKLEFCHAGLREVIISFKTYQVVNNGY
jgi:hypothetical protein